MVERFRIGGRNREASRPPPPSARIRFRVWVPGVMFVVLLLLSGVVLLHPSIAASPTAVPSTTSAPSFPTPIRHVVTIVAENSPLSTVDAFGSYEMSLAAQYPVASSYYAVCHPSAPEYLSLTSGQSLQCGSDTVSSYSVPNVGHLISGTPGLSWKAYMESMPSPCDRTDALPYVAHHDPFVYYSDLGANCSANVLPLKAWNESSSTQPNYVFLTPNRYDDGHTPSGSQGVRNFDQWLKGCLSGQGPNASVCGSGGLLHELWFSSSVIFIVYDEAEPATNVGGYPVSGVSNAWCNSHGASGQAVCGGLVYAIAVSPYTAGVQNYTGNATHYRLLSTTEWLLGLGCTGAGLDCNAGFPAMKSWFNFSSAVSPPTRYSINGVVTDAHGTAPSGTTLRWTNATGGGSVSVNASGDFSASLPNGTYLFTASAPGFISSEENVTVSGAPVSGLVFTLTQAAATLYSVQGNVSILGGTPPTNLTVTWWNSTDRATVGTNASRGFSVALPNGTFEFEAFAPGFQGYAVNLSVAGTAVTGVTLMLVAVVNGTYTAHVAVDNASSAYPIDGATVAVRGNTTAAENMTDAAGTCSFSLTNGTYRVWVNATGYTANVSTWTIGGVNASFQYALVPSNASPSNSSGNSSGTVTPPSFPVILQLVSVGEGIPVANRSCTITNYGNGSVVPMTTDSRGALQLMLPNGSYRLLVEVPGYSTASVAMVVLGTMTTNLTVQVEPVPTYSGAPAAPNRAPISQGSTVLLATVAGLWVASVAALGAIVIRRRAR